MKVFIALVALVAVAYACETNEYECANGNCIPGGWECDNDNDCGDGSDEAHCPCDGVKCPNTGVCIPETWICDGYNDCGDNSDERDCPCDEGEVKCPTTGECIKEEYWCDSDGIWDCNNGEDEANCTMNVYKRPNIQPTEVLRLRQKLGKLYRRMSKRQ